ncbi:hypothetical protein VUR80DRAFT_7151 [Thermomyces stellatus]
MKFSMYNSIYPTSNPATETTRSPYFVLVRYLDLGSATVGQPDGRRCHWLLGSWKLAFPGFQSGLNTTKPPSQSRLEPPLTQAIRSLNLSFSFYSLPLHSSRGPARRLRSRLSLLFRNLQYPFPDSP